MRLVLTAFVLSLSLAGSAMAAEEYIDLYPCMDPCCMFSAVCVDIECCGWCYETAPMTIQFLDADGNVLGSGVIDDWCGECAPDQQYADLDAMVNGAEVCSIRLITEFDECCFAEWASIKVLCEDPCDCPEWRMAWKGDLWCWMPMPEPEMVAEIPEVVRQPEPDRVAPAPRPEPKPEPVIPRPAPEPEPEPEPEVIHVEGRG